MAPAGHSLGGGWRLADAVLVSPNGTAYGDADLLTTGQVASLRGRSISEIGKQARKGRIPVTMTLPGNRALIRVADALAWEPRPAHRPRRQG